MNQSVYFESSRVANRPTLLQEPGVAAPPKLGLPKPFLFNPHSGEPPPSRQLRHVILWLLCVPRTGYASVTSGINAFLNRVKNAAVVRPLFRLVPVSAKAQLRRLVDWFTRPSLNARLLREASQTNSLLSLSIYEEHRRAVAAADPRHLVACGFKQYSQHDEDGIIEEIFRRIGTTNRIFIEFGVGDGTENCTVYLLLQGWSGLWIDGGAISYQQAIRQFEYATREKQLQIVHSFITAENIQELFARAAMPGEPDLLSIDIDNNDYWVWKAVVDYRPRLVAIEYNASFGPSADCVIPYDPFRVWDGTNYNGASLKALERLGREKGYTLVGCNYTGVTAFFVRDDLVGDAFNGPFVSERLYEPPRYFIRMLGGHPPAVGPLVLPSRPQ